MLPDKPFNKQLLDHHDKESSCCAQIDTIVRPALQQTANCLPDVHKKEAGGGCAQIDSVARQTLQQASLGSS